MNRNVLVSVLSIGILALPGLASADWHTFWAQFEKDRQRNQAWPLPFNQADQHSVRSIFGSMVKKGWEQQTVFQAFHFDQKTHQLNALGEKKLRWILQNVPRDRAALFVQKGLHPSVTEARLEHLENAANRLVADGLLLQAGTSETRPILMSGRNAEAQSNGSPAMSSSNSSTLGASTQSSR